MYLYRTQDNSHAGLLDTDTTQIRSTGKLSLVVRPRSAPLRYGDEDKVALVAGDVLSAVYRHSMSTPPSTIGVIRLACVTTSLTLKVCEMSQTH